MQRMHAAVVVLVLALSGLCVGAAPATEAVPTPEDQADPPKLLTMQEKRDQIAELTRQLAAALQAADYEKASGLVAKLTDRGHLPSETMQNALTPTAVDAIRKAAEGGAPAAQRIMAALCQMGEGVPQDATACAEWYRKAAEQGDGEAQYALATCYSFGAGVKLDNAQALSWFRKAAEQGVPGAEGRMGYVYAHGQGVPRDLKTAAEWYRKAADGGDAPSQFQLAGMYMRGDGVPVSPADAAHWYRKAGLQGDEDSQYALGLLYLLGRGVPKTDPEGVKWWRAAAERGQLDAQMGLGVAYSNGWFGLERDQSQAMSWLARAGNQYYVEGDIKRALDCYNRMARMDATDPAARALYAKLKGKDEPAPQATVAPPAAGGEAH